MARKTTDLNPVDADLVFAAACAAYRVQGEKYVKVGELRYDEKTATAIPVKSNREFLTDFLKEPESITQEDRDRSLLVRSYYQGLTFRLLSGKFIADLDLKALRLSQESTVNKLDFGLIAYLPHGYESAKIRQRADEKFSSATGGHLAKIGERITVKAEVIRCFYSQNYSVYFITAITDSDSVVSCSSKNKIERGTQVTITGTVKGYREKETQLSRPKIGVE